MTNLFLVAMGGALGATLRFLTSLFFSSFFSYSFFSTLIVNILGSFLIGVSIYLLDTKNFSQDLIKYFFVFGFLGSFTTFSAFSFETIDLILNNKIFLSLLNIIFSVTFCLIAAYIGLNIEKFLN